jgi:osmotically inducible lipoprotein OsmB
VITHRKEINMKTIKQLVVCASLATVTLGLAGCSGMSTQDRNTAIGAGAGAVVGGALTGGSAAGTVGGAAVGGVIGNQVKGDTH